MSRYALSPVNLYLSTAFAKLALDAVMLELGDALAPTVSTCGYERKNRRSGQRARTTASGTGVVTKTRPKTKSPASTKFFC